MRALIQLTSYKTVTELSSYVCLCEQIRQTVWLQLLPGRKLQYGQFFHNTKVVKNVLTVSHLKKEYQNLEAQTVILFLQNRSLLQEGQDAQIKKYSTFKLMQPREDCGLLLFCKQCLRKFFPVFKKSSFQLCYRSIQMFKIMLKFKEFCFQ